MNNNDNDNNNAILRFTEGLNCHDVKPYWRDIERSRNIILDCQNWMDSQNIDSSSLDECVDILRKFMKAFAKIK